MIALKSCGGGADAGGDHDGADGDCASVSRNVSKDNFGESILSYLYVGSRG